MTILLAGEKLSDEEVDALLSGVEDNQGQVNYEGNSDFVPGAHRLKKRACN